MPIQRLLDEDLTPGEIDLAAAIARGKVVPFIGSGVSIASSIEAGLPKAFPNWADFVGDLVRESGHPALAEAVSLFSTGFPELLQVLIDDTGTRHDVARVIHSRFGDDVPYTDIIARAPLLKRLQQARPPFVLTTNYDTLLERLWPSTPVLDPAITGVAGILEYLSEPTVPSDAPRAIIKVHGTVQRQERAAVSARDYRRLFTDTDAVQALFLWIGQRYSLWFLGYSLSDTDVQAALLTLQSRIPYRQHFWHKPRFTHPLEPRVTHVHFSVRPFEVENAKLTARVASITALSGQLKTLPPVSLFRSPDEDFFRAVIVLSRFELPESQPLAAAIVDPWLTELREETENWTRAPRGAAWRRVLAAERVLRHLLFLADRFEDRKQLSRYLMGVAGRVPPSFRLDAAGAIAEGLAYVDKSDSEHALSVARDLITLYAAKHNRDFHSLAFANSLVARSEAKWEPELEKKWKALDGVVRTAAQSRAPEFHAACLLDRAWIAVSELLDKWDRANPLWLSEGVVAARAALELALFGGSYRRASIALQRLAFLDEDASAFWAGQAVKLQRDMHLPHEERNQFYLDCSVAVSLWRTRQQHYALTLVARYDKRWLKAHALPADRRFLRKFVKLLQH
jgi:hypothetical protein